MPMGVDDAAWAVEGDKSMPMGWDDAAWGAYMASQVGLKIYKKREAEHRSFFQKKSKGNSH